jgi:DNA-binding NarL/FixJ family response regulator
MALRFRPMRSKDVRQCVEIVATNSVVSPRYGSAIVHLETAWLRLLGREAFRALVFEELGRSDVTVVGVGVSTFVSDDFLRTLKTPPLVWAGAEMVKRVMRGESPLLSDKEVRQANADGGLNVVVWEGTIREVFRNRPEVHNTLLATFVDVHRGFLLKEMLGQMTSEEALQATVHSGNLFLSSTDGQYIDYMEKSAQALLAEPHFIGINRELALDRVGTWIGSLFVYQFPQFGFRPSEQRLLLAALQGGTDQDLADVLGISLSAVKKTWRLIYDRVIARSPGLIPDQVPEELTSERGKEKKQRLLAYLREHPEELRPATL